ncbi:TLE family member 5 isoform X2 [Girardinichthys multiradiatus]|uniref:TLE family member 5 isoform X2 n=1 Tax=Girardinichthys multiradiatus TaxID=208333 RepID=UPI001FACCB4D|nr:TLE family member 5 isoform X2 [Girardinichthys multiradiatus]
MMFPQSRHSASSQQLKFTTSDSCDRIKDEFQFLQAQYHSLKLECDKLASEKSEMQRHYIMAEIVKRLNGICAQVLPYLSQEHQQQVLAAIERAKQVTPPEMNSIIRMVLLKMASVIHSYAADLIDLEISALYLRTHDRIFTAAPGSPAVPASGPGPAHDPPASGPEPANAPSRHHFLRSLLAVFSAGLPGPAGQGGEGFP